MSTRLFCPIGRIQGEYVGRFRQRDQGVDAKRSGEATSSGGLVRAKAIHLVTSVALALGCVGCNVPPPAKATGCPDLTTGNCGRGLVIVGSDYLSTNISVASFDGETLSPSILSSGSAPAGISAAFSGDVVAPSEEPVSDDLVLIDRSVGVLTWFGWAGCAVTNQLSVATGFDSNPHDYVDLGGGKSYVTRYNSNPAPGQQPFDGGGDILTIDVTRLSIVGRIDLATSADSTLEPRPDRMLRVRGEVLVLLQRFSADFKSIGDSQLVGIDPARDVISWVVSMSGLENCGGMLLSVSGNELYVSCSGGFFRNEPAQIARSGVIRFDMTVSPPMELQRYAVANSLAAPLAPTLTTAFPGMLLGVAYGNKAVGRADQVYSLDVDTGKVLAIGAASDAMVLGNVLCLDGCGDRCFVPDGQAAGLRRWLVSEGGLHEEPVIPGERLVGLPPRQIVRF